MMFGEIYRERCPYRDCVAKKRARRLPRHVTVRKLSCVSSNDSIMACQSTKHSNIFQRNNIGVAATRILLKILSPTTNLVAAWIPLAAATTRTSRTGCIPLSPPRTRLDSSLRRPRTGLISSLRRVRFFSPSTTNRVGQCLLPPLSAASSRPRPAWHGGISASA